MTNNATKDAFTIGRTVRELGRAFAEAGLETPGLDARLLAAHVTGTEPSLSFTNPDFELDSGMAKDLAAVSERRLAGEPVHRIMGAREFYGLALALGPDTLEPRPDTETLVDAVLPFINDVVARKGTCRVLDLGTGTGAIGLAIASQSVATKIVGTDAAAGAVRIANANAESLGLANQFRAVQADWFPLAAGKFDLVVSNPPYIPAADIELLDREVRDHDPHLALNGGADGLDAYRAIACGAGRFLAESGQVAVEIGAGQAMAVRGIFESKGLGFVNSQSDLGEIERVLVFRLAAAIC